MIKNLLFSSLLAFSSGSSLLNDKAPFNSTYDFIDNNYPSFRIGDYEITKLEHINAAGGQVRVNLLEVIIPRVVFDILGEYQQTFIFLPNYAYNKSADLQMRMAYFYDGSFAMPIYDDMEYLPLSEAMLTVLPYTIVDLPYKLRSNSNFFNPNNWDNDELQQIRLTFEVPYTEHQQPSATILQELRNITLFTERNYSDAASYQYGYNDGYVDGNNDGVQTGYDNGYSHGYNDGVASDFNSYSWLTGIFSAMGGLLSIQLLPNVSIGGILILVMVLTLLPFLIGLLKGGKD